MTDKNLLRIAELCGAFKQAAEDSREAHDVKLQQKLLKSLQPGEMEKMQSLLQEVVTESLGYALGGEPSDEFVKKNIKLCEITADLFLRVVPEKTAASYLPAELKNKADADVLRSVGAPKLAHLCELKK